MKNKTVLFIAGLVVLAMLSQFGVAAGQDSEPTVSSLPDGSILIYGQIQYNDKLKGYVVQAQVPPGEHGEYLIVNPENMPLSALAKKGTLVNVQGMLTQGAFLLQVQTINGKTYN